MEKVFLGTHLISLTFTFWTVFHADHMGLNWMRGKTPTLNEALVKKYHRNTWIGLALMITTGILLFLPMREYLLSRPQFLVKMAFVVTLICNGFVINHLMKKAIHAEFKNLTLREKLPLLISGAVSSLAWLGATVGAFYISEY